jgi:structural maintenance of chromosome 2
VASTNKEITQAQSKIEKMTKAIKAAELEIQQLTHKMSKATDEAKEAKRTVEAMLGQHEWIAVDRKFFGQPNTAYDFKATDPKEVKRGCKFKPFVFAD